MNPIRRLTAALAGLAGALLACAAVAPAALAQPFPPRPPGWDKHPPYSAGIQIVMAGGMPGWQIALIAVGTALLAATAAVLADRAWTAHRKPVTAADLAEPVDSRPGCSSGCSSEPCEGVQDGPVREVGPAWTDPDGYAPSC